VSDFYEQRGDRIVELAKMALAEAGYPNAEVWRHGLCTHITTDEPGHPPREIADRAMELVELQVDAGLHPALCRTALQTAASAESDSTTEVTFPDGRQARYYR